ncbi:MAG TPA: helix-turn-helix transcriptional regulator [Zoogloea sp.]|jgi:transcriptional regulator with XRE-family HTH domain|uniref:helix-turn-helix domain-containing protein n=1 Tax=Zoogloea sp. TaxID=49181 RepID=UPI002C956141|nr:helix-turn-helix transcriptional regulator [Zoogloea sp.]HOB47040.1 helix-turn-helix transcriptional regulator [Zoogloea sp.]HQA10669.1 helix-turn-helix transcriptional regulator [Zoogloea sp.]HQE39572.1 helix-turn-helix transcriptional regulator [Zoogloea sp.]
MTSLSASFGAVVRHLREERGWSQEQLAEFADLNRSYVGDLERGRAMPSLATLTKVASALDLQASALIARFESLQAGRPPA